MKQGIESTSKVAMVVTALGICATEARAAEPPMAADTVVRGTYLPVDLPADRTAPVPTQAGGAPHILFLNNCEGGLMISPGNGGSIANETFMAPAPVVFPAYPYGEAAWEEVMDHAREIFGPFNITVTDVDPGQVSHDEAVVCGSPGLLGMSPYVGGVAPFSCSVINNPITFTFAENLGNNPRLHAEVVGQEAAHAWGLDHELLCEDPMTYLNGCGDKSFQDIDAQCGEDVPRECLCGGATQNSYQHIMSVFGAGVPDTQAPTAAITYPADGEVFGLGADFQISVDVSDDVEIDSVSLFLDGQLEGTDPSGPFGPWPASDFPEGSYELHIEAGDTAGNVTISSVVTFHVSVDGQPPPPPPNEDSDGMDDDPSNDTDGESPGTTGGPGSGALPPGLTAGAMLDDPAVTGCGCRSRGSGGALGWGALLLVAGMGLRRRRPS